MRLFDSRSLSRWSLRAIAFVAPAAGVGACSLVNSFGDVKEAPPDSSADTTGMMETGPVETGGHDGESGASETSTEGGPNFPDLGCIVVSGRVSDDAGNLQGVLTAIDPVTGNELPKARQMLNVPVVLYDGRRDIWYVIETNGQSLFPTPTDKAVLHVRTLNPDPKSAAGGTWTDLGSLQVPPPVFGLSAVLSNRLVYVGFDNTVDSASGTSFVTIDTSDPTNPTIYPGAPGLDVQPQGIIGTRSRTGNGGPVNMLESVPCPNDGGTVDDAGDAGGGIGGGYCLRVQHVTVPTNPDPATLTFYVDLGPFFGRPAYGSYLGLPPGDSPTDVIAWSLPGGNPGSPGPTQIHTYQPSNEAIAGTAIPYQTSDGFFQPFAFAECQQQAILTATNEDLSVYAIPLSSAGGTLAQAMTTHSGQSVAFEPYTNTVLSPFTQGDGYVLDAFTLGGTVAKPTLTQRSMGWNPPADVRPEVLAIRKPLPLTCPP
jgi:hypothetical protein